jgi:hypothetical protein
MTFAAFAFAVSLALLLVPVVDVPVALLFALVLAGVTG